MKKWKCIIVDDEPVAIRIIRQHLARLNNYEVVHTSSNGLDAFEYLTRKPVDLLLLDIEMPEFNGLELFRSLEHPPALIFITAHRDYAVEGFELNALDYLMKPVSFPRLMKALNRFEQSRQSTAPDHTPSEHIFVTVDRKKRRIELNDIIYVESLKDYLRIYTEDEKIITKETLSDFEQQLPTRQFLRVHRSFIINTAKIQTVSYDEITVGTETIPIGRTYRDEVMSRLEIE